MVLMVDNYDSFTYNLVQMLMVLGCEVRVVRNDRITVSEVAALQPEAVVISPGPCTPDQAGVSVDLIRELSGEVPMLGICLGHQCLARAFGGEVVHARRIMHGKVSKITHNGAGVLAGLRSPFSAIRYHSLAVAECSLPACLEITASAEDGEIMGLRHREHCTHGVQFHPESILTPVGKRLVKNFLTVAA